MEPNSTYYTNLVTRYFCGEATPAEILLLEDWVKSDPANRELFTEYGKTWATLENLQTGSSIDLDLEWGVMKSKIKDQKSKIKDQKSKIKNQKSKIKNQIRNPKSEIRNPKSGIIYWSLRIAAVFVLLAVPAFFLFRNFAPPSNLQLAAGNEIIERTLPDGTAVTLNAGAILEYPSRFEGSFRKVSLKGEAWFVVAHDRSKPFIVSAENVKVRVLGTSFFMNTKTIDNTKEVILSEGHVKVYYEDRPDKMALLSPGDKAELTTKGYEITQTANRDENYLSWKTKHLVFTDTPLNEVVALLTNVYHTRIRISDNRLSDCRITTTFDRQSLESVLNVLKATLDLQIRNTGAGIEISGHGCK